MAPRVRSNPLALAVLVSLHERPMHPYEIAHTLRSRAKHESIRLNYGSLYSVVESLESRSLIEVREVVREGRRPERTIYQITPAGSTEMTDWLGELVSVPAKEYTSFEAALSLLPALPPEEALSALRERRDALEWAITRRHIEREAASRMGLPRLFDLENEYQDAMGAAELAYLGSLIGDLESEDLDGLSLWRAMYDESAPPAGAPFWELAPASAHRPDQDPGTDQLPDRESGTDGQANRESGTDRQANSRADRERKGR